MELRDYISLLAISISVTSLALSIYERKIKLSAYLGCDDNGDFIDIYNLSSRKITVSYFKIYSSAFKHFFTKDYADTFYEYGMNGKIIIEPHEYETVTFYEEYNINAFLNKSQNKRIYISIFVSGKKAKTIRLR